MSDVMDAIAQSLWAEFHRKKPERFPSCPNPQRWRDLARAAIRAVTERGGLVVGKMPEEWSDTGNGSQHMQAFYDDRNHALAAVRANAAKVEEV